MAKKTMADWPIGMKPMRVEELVRPLKSAIQQAFELKGRKLLIDGIKWGGPGFGHPSASWEESPAAALSSSGIKRAAEAGRDPLEQILVVAINLGIEQGKRVAVEKLGGAESVNLFVDTLRSKNDGVLSAFAKVLEGCTR